jgi:predicted lipoprotein with Yx(FWY)xxD motif
MKNQYTVVIAAAALALSACASSPAKMEGGALTGATSMTLYTFDRDTAGNGKSVCNGFCATNWPAMIAADRAKPYGEYTIITRDDGKKQYAYKGKPLYYFVKDQKPGDKLGDGFMNGAWHLAQQ